MNDVQFPPGNGSCLFAKSVNQVNSILFLDIIDDPNLTRSVPDSKFMQSGTDPGEAQAKRHFKSVPALKKDHCIGYLKTRILGQGKQKLLDRAPAAGCLVVLDLHWMIISYN